MEDMNITFLGTGNAIPTETRNHSSILININEENLLFDCGEGTQRQFKKANISPTKITKIFITHWHGDHILGLPGLIQTLAMQNYQKTLEIYGPRGTLDFIKKIEDLIGKINIKIKVQEVQKKVFENKRILIEAEEMTHGTPCLAYSITLKDNLRLNKKKIKQYKLPNSPILRDLLLGKDIVWKNKKIKSSSIVYKEKGKKITIILDTSFNQKSVSLAKNSDLLIAESTFSDEEKEKAQEYKHLTAKQSAEIAKKSKSKALLLTHISQKFENSLSILEKEAKKVFKNTKIAKDLQATKI